MNQENKKFCKDDLQLRDILEDRAGVKWIAIIGFYKNNNVIRSDYGLEMVIDCWDNTLSDGDSDKSPWDIMKVSRGGNVIWERKKKLTKEDKVKLYELFCTVKHSFTESKYYVFEDTITIVLGFNLNDRKVWHISDISIDAYRSCYKYMDSCCPKLSVHLKHPVKPVDIDVTHKPVRRKHQDQ